jgi:His/Glu/Gln/Arg/opine family amino acid ABC transporter permease subunit
MVSGLTFRQNNPPDPGDREHYSQHFSLSPHPPITSPPHYPPLPQKPVENSLGIILDAMPRLLQGALVTLELTAFAILIGITAGSLIGISRLSSALPLRWAARAYTDFFRGTPLLVQIFMVYFGIPAVTAGLGYPVRMTQLVAAVTALSLNCAAYLAEIVRAGIQSIEIGQREAAESLGLGPIETMRYVIFPQAFRRMIPPIGNEFISLLKDTSLVAVIGFEELFRKGQLIVAQNYRAFEIYAAVALVYLALTLLSSQAFSWLERWMNPVERSKNRSIAPSTLVTDSRDHPAEL